jgi:hypothetical protein
MPWGKNEGYQRRREKHLNYGNVSFVAAEYLGEWIGVIYAEASRGTCGLDISSRSIIRDENSAPTARQPKSWLKVTKLRAIAECEILVLKDFVGTQGFAVY